MKRLIIIVCLLSIATITAFAQKEANNWFFGRNAGLTWNTTRSMTLTGLLGTPNAELTMPDEVPGSSINTWEGCFSLSDASGNLLFYSDGVTIWNKNHAVMQNGSGLTGNTSSAQSGIVMPYPGNPNQYIAITMRQAVTDDMNYSVIDMSQNGGLGRVITKNVRFTGNKGLLGESETTIQHANGRDWWVVAPGLPIAAEPNRSYLNAWLVTSSGVQNTTPVTTELPTHYLFEQLLGRGYIKFTPDGKHFVWATWASENLFFGDFDASTGEFSNLKTLNLPIVPKHGPYGIEFSPSGKYVYVSFAIRPHLYIYELATLLANPLTANRIIKEFPSNENVGALQLGPDGYLYGIYKSDVGGTYESQEFLVIDNPDDVDNLRMYNARLIATNGAGGIIGLPSFSASWWNLDIDDIETDTGLPVCRDTEITFSAALSSSDISQIAHIKWNFGDGTVVKDTNIGATISQKHTYKNKGTYTLTLTPYKTDGTIVTGSIKTLEVEILPCAIPVNPNIHTSAY